MPKTSENSLSLTLWWIHARQNTVFVAQQPRKPRTSVQYSNGFVAHVIFFYPFFFHFIRKQIVAVVHYGFLRVSSVINRNAINGLETNCTWWNNKRKCTHSHTHTLIRHYVIKLSLLLSCHYFLRCRSVLSANIALYSHTVVHSRRPHVFDQTIHTSQRYFDLI